MSETASKVSAALVAAQGEIGNVPFDSTNPHFGSKFVSLAAVLSAVRPVLAKHGIGLHQPASTANGMIQVQTVFLHASGEQIAFPPLAMPIGEKATAQQLGSTVTYLRRYSLTAALGIAGARSRSGALAGRRMVLARAHRASHRLPLAHFRTGPRPQDCPRLARSADRPHDFPTSRALDPAPPSA